MIPEFYVFLVVIAIAIIIVAAIIFAVFIEMKKDRQKASQSGD